MQLVKWMWFRRWSLMSPFTSLRILFRTALVILRTSMPPPRQSISVDKETNHRVSHSPKFEFSWPDPAGTSRVLLKPSQNLPGNEAEIRQPHRLPMTNETLISLKSLFFSLVRAPNSFQIPLKFAKLFAWITATLSNSQAQSP